MTVALTACKFHSPEFRGEEKFSFEGKEGNEIKLTAGGKVYNGNWFGIKVKPSELDLYVDNEYLGKVHLDKKVKMKAKRETMLEAPLTLKPDAGALLKAVKLVMKNDLEIRLKGNVKGGVFIFSKKFEIDETTTIKGNPFRK